MHGRMTKYGLSVGETVGKGGKKKRKRTGEGKPLVKEVGGCVLSKKEEVKEEERYEKKERN